MNPFISLYETSLSNSLTDDQRRINTEQIITLLNDIDCSEYLFEILSTRNLQNSTIYYCAAIGIKKYLENHWFNIFKSNKSNFFVEKLINLLEQQIGSNKKLYMLLVDGFDIIFSCNEFDNTVFANHVNHYLNIDEINTLSCVIYMAYRMCLSSDLSENAIEFYFNIVKRGLSINDPGIYGWICNIFSCILECKVIVENEEILYIFQTIFNFYMSILQKNDKIFPELSSGLSKSLNTGKLSSISKKVFFTLIELADNDKVSSVLYISIFQILESMIKPYRNHFLEFMDPFINVSLKCGTMSEETDLYFIAGSFETFMQEFGEDSFNIFLKLFDHNGCDEYIVTLSTFTMFLFENLEPFLMSKLAFLIQFFTNEIERSAYVKVSILQTFSCISKILNNEQADYVLPIVDVCVNQLSISSDPHIIIEVLKSLSDALHVAKIPDKYIEVILEKIFDYSQSGNHLLLQECAYTLSVLIFSSEDMIIPYLPQISQYLMQLCNIQADNRSIIVSDAIHAMSFIVKYLPEEMNEKLSNLLSMILKSGLTDDDFIRNSAVLAIGNYISYHYDGLIDLKKDILALLDRCFYSSFINEDQEDLNTNALNAIQSAINVVDQIYTSFAELCPDNPTHYYDGCSIIGFELGIDFLIEPAIRACSNIVIFHKDERMLTQYCQLLLDNFDSCTIEISNGIIVSLNILVKSSMIPPDDLYRLLIDKVLECALHELPEFEDYNEYCTISEANWYDESNPVAKIDNNTYNLIADIVIFTHQIFSTSDLITFANNVFETKDKRLISKVCLTLSKVYTSNPIDTHIGEIITSVFDDTVLYLDMIVSIYNVYIVDPHKFPSIYTIVPTLISFLKSENNSTKSYYSCVPTIISLLFLLYKNSTENFNIFDLLPYVLPELPLKLEHFHSENIYSLLVSFMDDQKLLNIYCDEVLRVFVEILSAHQVLLDKMQLSDATYDKIKKVTRMILSFKGQSLLNSLCDMEIKKLRVLERLGI